MLNKTISSLFVMIILLTSTNALAARCVGIGEGGGGGSICCSSSGGVLTCEEK